MGLLKWIDMTVSAKSYFTLNTDHTPLHLVLLDEVCRELKSLLVEVVDKGWCQGMRLQKLKVNSLQITKNLTELVHNTYQ